MNCTNCGAAMELVESRRYFQCRYCGTFQFPDPVDADGVRVLGPTADAPPCPVCDDKLNAAVLDTNYPVHFCGRCRGMLVPRVTFATVVAKRRAWATGMPIEPIALDRAALGRQLNCPRCGRRFETYPHYGPGNVVIDSCGACDVIWLDFGEIRQIVDAPGKDRGSQTVPNIDDDYVRKGSAREDDEDEEWVRRRKRGDALGLLLDVMFDD